MISLAARTLDACADRLPAPRYDRSRVTTGVVHVGVGGFHRAHQAMYQDRAMNAGGALDWGICGVGLLPGDRRMQEALLAQDCLYTLVVKHPDGRYEPRVMGALTAYLFAPDDPGAVVERMAAASTRVVSLTITEGGYPVDDVTGAFDADDPAVARDLAGSSAPRTAFGLVVEALRRRRERGLPPFTVLSCDNLEANGDVARRAFAGFARLRDGALGDWVERTVRFPNSVVDRITPATTDADRAELRERVGIDDRWPVVCEPFEQWVLEDVATRRPFPPYADVGARIVDDVRPYERMKLRLLNAGHQAIAYFGLLRGHRLVHEAVEDPLIRALLVGYLVEEATPTVTGVPAGELAAYRDGLVDRFANPATGDTLERLAMYASDRIPKFVLPVIRAQLATGGEIRRSAAVVASWARFAAGVDESGAPLGYVDRRRDRLMAAARRRGEDPLAFVAVRDVFGDLVGDERFVAAYRTALASLDDRGAKATLGVLA